MELTVSVTHWAPWVAIRWKKDMMVSPTSLDDSTAGVSENTTRSTEIPTSTIRVNSFLNLTKKFDSFRMGPQALVFDMVQFFA